MIFVIIDSGLAIGTGAATPSVGPGGRLAQRQAHDARVASVFGELDRLTRATYVIAPPARREP